MEIYDLAIIGSGASGLMAGITALKEGVKNVIILENEYDLGGNLNLFIDDGFGGSYLETTVTGPEFSCILQENYGELGGVSKRDTKVLKISEDKIITYVNPKEGISEIQSKAIVVATGCREKFTGNITVPIHKYTGVFTVKAAHKLINYKGYLPGSEVVVSGNDIWSFILARRLLIEGANVKAIIVDTETLAENILSVIDRFDIPVIFNSTVTEIGGDEKIKWVKIEDKDHKATTIECDSLILSIGYYPELEVLRSLNIKMNGIYPVTENYETSIKGIYTCGTINSGAEGLFNSGEEGAIVGKIVATVLSKK